jgi:CubicO group peptidase (beta-lactamase class C family)
MNTIKADMKLTRRAGLVAISSLFVPVANVWSGDFGLSKGFPFGWPEKNERGGQPMPWQDESLNVGNFSGGIETFWPSSTVKAFNKRSEMKKGEALPEHLVMRIKNLQKKAGKTAVLVIRNGQISFENYEFDRVESMRFLGKSMTKSVLSLLTGIALEKGIIKSLDESVGKYAPRVLEKSGLNAITIQNALNMSGGANICIPNHCSAPRDDIEKWQWASSGLPRNRLRGTNVDRVLAQWSHGMKYQQGTRFEYNPVDPSLIGLVLREASGQSLSTFASDVMWRPMGAEMDGAWLTDAFGHEDVDGGFLATARDWGRLGLLVANGGRANQKQIVPESYIQKCRDTSANFEYLSPGKIEGKLLNAGYKNFFHLPAESVSWLKFQGSEGQTILADRQSGTVFVVLSASGQDGYNGTYENIFSEILRLT